jgi:thiamine biosynthesis protein ThiI
LGNSEIISVHFAEIALKGRNRSDFENALVANVRAALGPGAGRIERTESRILIHPKVDAAEASQKLGKVFGIAWFSPSYVVGRDIGGIKELVLEKSKGIMGRKLRVEASRADKSFLMTSPDINREVGQALEQGGHSIDIRNPEQRIYIEILRDRALVSFGRIPGPGGLPVGTAGKVLSLLSGGIDSPAASWLMMKRGCAVDFLHIHSGAYAKEALESKIPRLVRKLREYSPLRCRLFIAPYTEFYKKSLNADPKAELVVFRRFILRLAERIARENGHLGIVTGDNIGQVASQTLENLAAVADSTTLPVYRPLLTYDKQEIVALAERIGTYRISIEEYKDCCSLVAAKHPSTRVRPEKARAIEEEIGIGSIIEKTLEQAECVEI